MPRFDHEHKSHMWGMEEQKAKEPASLKASTWSQHQPWTSNFQITHYIRKINPHFDESLWWAFCHMQPMHPNWYLALASNSACFMQDAYIIILTLSLFSPVSQVWSCSSASLVFDPPSFLLPIFRYPNLVHFHTTYLGTRPLFLTLGYFLINLLWVQSSAMAPEA